MDERSVLDDIADHQGNGRIKNELLALARLSPLEYDSIRKAKAKEMGVRLGILDKEIAKRREIESEDDAYEVVEEISPWDEPVNGALLLDELREIIERHVVLQDGASIALSLWILGSYCMDAWRLFAKLLVTSPQKRCGKSTLMETIEGLLYRSLLASNISAAALFRSIEEWRPSLLIDEADRFVKENEELNGIINAGHTRRTAFVLRVEKINDRHIPQKFSVWGAQALAGIGKQQDTLMDRSIIIEIRRKANGETCHRLPLDHFEQCQPVRRRCLRWAIDHIEALKQAAPDVPVCGNDRAQDNWHPLFAIAELAGGDWPGAVKHAYRVITSTIEEEDTIGTMLLSDIRQIFDKNGYDRISSERLIAGLTGLQDRPWSEWKHGKPITPSSLARLLSPFKIKSNTVRVGKVTIKGYKREQFSESWNRYLSSPDTHVQGVTTSQPCNGAGFSDFQGGTRDDDVTPHKRRKPSNGAACDVETAKNAGTGNEGDAYMPGWLISAAVTACHGLGLDPCQFLTEVDPADYIDIMTDLGYARNYAVALDGRLA